MASPWLHINLAVVHPQLDHGWPYSPNCSYHCCFSRSIPACFWRFPCGQASSIN